LMRTFCCACAAGRASTTLAAAAIQILFIPPSSIR
jgi:hypothetical protein